MHLLPAADIAFDWPHKSTWNTAELRNTFHWLHVTVLPFPSENVIISLQVGSN
jgi:hypothetical protein